MNIIRFPRNAVRPDNLSVEAGCVRAEGAPQVEVCAALTQIGAADESLISPERLLLAAAEFSPDQALTLSILKSRAGYLGRLQLRLGGQFATAAQAAVTLDRLALLVGSKSRFKSARGFDAPQLVWTPLAPRGESVHAGSDVSGRAQHVTLAPCLAAAADFACALAAAERAGVSAFEISLRSIKLDAQEILAINQATDRLSGLPRSRRPAGDELTHALAAWSKRGAGVVFDVRVGAEGVIDAADLDAMALALFGRARGEATLSEDTIDLRMAAPVGAGPAWRFWPTAHDLRPPAKSIESPTERCAGSVTLGFDDAGDSVCLGPDDRMRHLFVLGGTGTGKTTFLGEMIREDIEGGEGIILIDPHGELADKAERVVPLARRDDFILVDPSDRACAARLDLLTTPGIDPDLERNFIVNQLITLLSRQMYAGIPEAFGPAFENYFRNLCFLLMSAKKPRSAISCGCRIYLPTACFATDLSKTATMRLCASSFAARSRLMASMPSTTSAPTSPAR